MASSDTTFPAPEHLDTMNDSMVSLAKGNMICLLRYRFMLTKPEALRLAAWIVAISASDAEFQALLAAVRKT